MSISFIDDDMIFLSSSEAQRSCLKRGSNVVAVCRRKFTEVSLYLKQFTITNHAQNKVAVLKVTNMGNRKELFSLTNTEEVS